VPWARVADISALATPEELRALVGRAGFGITAWVDTTPTARNSFTTMVEKLRRDGPPPVSIHLLMGSDLTVMANNMLRNLQEGRILVAHVVATKQREAETSPSLRVVP
jgi:hypothetical protein